MPTNLAYFQKLLFKNKLKPRSKVAQMKYHYFELDGGYKFKRLKGSFYGEPYKFRSKLVEFNFFVKCLYLIGKGIEKYLYTNIMNYYFYKFKRFSNEIKQR